MASSTSYFPILLLLLLSLLSSLHARDSQFFSKVSNDNNVVKVEATKVLPTKNQEQEPNFIPQNEQNSGYGLYGHESGQLPPTTTTTTTAVAANENLPYKSESEEPYKYYSNFNTNNDGFVSEPQGMSDTRFMEKPYTTPIGNHNNYYNGGNMYNNRQKQQEGLGEAKFGAKNGYNNYNNNGGNMYNNEKKGMSDTRFLENGKYFYDLNSENNYNLNAKENSRNEYYNNNRGNSFGSRSEYNSNRGQFGNNEKSYEVNNSMEGGYYNPNQEEVQDERFMP